MTRLSLPLTIAVLSLLLHECDRQEARTPEPLVHQVVAQTETSGLISPEPETNPTPELPPSPPILELPLEYLFRIHIGPSSRHPLTVNLILPVDHERLYSFDPEHGLILPPGSPWTHGFNPGSSHTLETHASAQASITSFTPPIEPSFTGEGGSRPMVSHRSAL